MRTDARVDARLRRRAHFDKLSRLECDRDEVGDCSERRVVRDTRRGCVQPPASPGYGDRARCAVREALRERARDRVPDLGRRAGGAQRCRRAEHVRRSPSLFEREQGVDQRLCRQAAAAPYGNGVPPRAAHASRTPSASRCRGRVHAAPLPGRARRPPTGPRSASAIRVAPRPLQARTRARPSSPSATMPAASRRAAVRRASR